MDGKRLKKLRKDKGLTQDELGKILGVTKSSICCYEKGTRNPSIETIVDMMLLYNVSSDYLIGSDSVVTVFNNENIRNEIVTKEEYAFILALRKNRYLAEILLEDPERSVELIGKKIG